MRWNNINSYPTLDQNLTLLDVICILVFDAVLYMVIAYYIDAVTSGEFGIARPWDFPFQVRDLLITILQIGVQQSFSRILAS